MLRWDRDNPDRRPASSTRASLAPIKIPEAEAAAAPQDGRSSPGRPPGTFSQPRSPQLRHAVPAYASQQLIRQMPPLSGRSSAYEPLGSRLHSERSETPNTTMDDGAGLTNRCVENWLSMCRRTHMGVCPSRRAEKDMGRVKMRSFSCINGMLGHLQMHAHVPLGWMGHRGQTQMYDATGPTTSVEAHSDVTLASPGGRSLPLSFESRYCLLNGFHSPLRWERRDMHSLLVLRH